MALIMNTVMLTNLNSGKNLRDKHRVKVLRKLLGNKGILFSTKTKDDLEKIVSNLHTHNPEKVILDGGDGTLTVFLGLLLQYWPEEKPLPPFGLMAGGTFNILSRQCKVRNPKKYLAEIINSSEEELYYQNVDMMKIEDNNGLASYGFSFGTGMPITLLEEYYKHKKLKLLKVAFMISRILFSGMFRHKYYEKFNQKEVLEIKAGIDGKEIGAKMPFLGLMAQTIESIGIKFSRPFYKAGLRPNYFHAIGTGMELSDLMYYALPLYFGKQVPNVQLDLQAESLDIKAEHPVRYQVNGELELLGKPYLANEISVRHGITLKVIKTVPKGKP